MNKNRLIIAAAGSGKTTRLVRDALSIENGNVLITTFTDGNEQEIRNKIIRINKCIPKNITVQTWFSFLLQHGVRPYQGVMADDLFYKRIGFCLFEGKSGFRFRDKSGRPVYWGESDTYNFYFTKNLRIYSDKIAKFVFECNQITNNEVIYRLSRIYSAIFIDEVQDLAGWDLELLKLLFASGSTIQMGGDPRQGTYSTNDSSLHKRYRNGKVKEFIEEKCKKGACSIDTNSLNKSHRNNKWICAFASKLYPEHVACEPCDCEDCRKDTPSHLGVFLIKQADVNIYYERYKPITKLHYREARLPDLNYGASKGLGFDRVLIYPTEKIRRFLKSGDLSEIESVRAKFYVAVTRARHSVGIVCDYDDGEYVEGIRKYIPDEKE